MESNQSQKETEREEGNQVPSKEEILSDESIPDTVKEIVEEADNEVNNLGGTFSEEEYREKVNEIYPKLLRDFNYPYLNGIELVSKKWTDFFTQPTAKYSSFTKKVTVSQFFLDLLNPETEEELYTYVNGIEKHEMGHHSFHPRRLATSISLARKAEQVFDDEYKDDILATYNDVANEIGILNASYHFEDLQSMRKKLMDTSLKDTIGGEIYKLMLGLYEYRFDDLEQHDTLNSKEREWVEDLHHIKYMEDDIGVQQRNLVLFGNIIKEVIEYFKQENPPVQKGPSFPGQGDQEGRPEEGDYQEGEGKGEPDSLMPLNEILKSNKTKPFGGSSLDDVPQEEIDEALTEILEERGKKRFEKSKEFVESKRGDYEDPFDATVESSKHAGLGDSEFEENEDLVAIYKRLAADFPCYVVKKPTETDKTSTYRGGRKPFEVEDPLRKINVHGSRGIVGIPGVSQIDLEEEGIRQIEELDLPDLNLGIDSSGSMDHPEKVSEAVLAAFILGENYYNNGSKVGGFNFSSSLAFLSPTRDIKQYHSLMCGYWGGGTVINREKLEEYIAEMDEESGIRFTDRGDYKRQLSRMSQEERQQFIDKDLDVDIQKLDRNYQRLDNVLITDGYIHNIEKVLGYLNEIGEKCRNFVFITEESQYQEWSEKDIENTWVYQANEQGDLKDLSVGVARDLQNQVRRKKD